MILSANAAGRRREEIVANVKWAKNWKTVYASKPSVNEALRLPNVIMFGCWLGAVEEKGHDYAMQWAWKYDAELRSWGEENYVEIDSAEAERRRNEWNAEEGALISDEEVESRRCGMSDWN
jgi:hypothetical protein